MNICNHIPQILWVYKLFPEIHHAHVTMLKVEEINFVLQHLDPKFKIIRLN